MANYIMLHWLAYESGTLISRLHFIEFNLKVTIAELEYACQPQEDCLYRGRTLLLLLLTIFVLFCC